MNGVATTGTMTGDLMRTTGFRVIVGGATWCLFAYGAQTIGNQPESKVAAVLFCIATLVMIVGGLYRLIRCNRPAAAKQAAIRDVPVTQCLRAPMQAPDLRQAYAAHPEYCAPLFQRHESRNTPTAP